MADLASVEQADRYSKKRATLAGIAALAFLGVQAAAFPRALAGDERTFLDYWVVAALALLGVLATGGGLLAPRAVRRLADDELGRSNLRRAIVIGYWVAMAVALGLYLGPWFRDLTARQAIYFIVTSSIAVSLFAFAALERRSAADG